MESEIKLEEKLHEIFTLKNISLGLAESCTGGAIAARLTQVSGASDYFLGSMVCYTTPIKIKLLQVSPENIHKYEVVSHEIACEMAEKTLALFETDYALSVTGYMGPTGGTPASPIGTVYIGIAEKNGNTRAHYRHFSGDRISNINQVVDKAIELLLLRINET